MSKRSTELLPCPFCGGEAVAANGLVECAGDCSCPLVGLAYDFQAWNTRAALEVKGEDFLFHRCNHCGGMYQGETVTECDCVVGVGKQSFERMTLTRAYNESAIRADERKRVADLIRAARSLLMLRSYKRVNGADDYYRERKEHRWNDLEEAIRKLAEKEG